MQHTAQGGLQFVEINIAQIQPLFHFRPGRGAHVGAQALFIARLEQLGRLFKAPIFKQLANQRIAHILFIILKFGVWLRQQAERFEIKQLRGDQQKIGQRPRLDGRRPVDHLHILVSHRQQADGIDI